MTEYKIGDKVLVEGEFCNVQTLSGYECIIFKNNDGWDKVIVQPELLRPYTPRQEFEYGEEVEVSDSEIEWCKGLFIGVSHDKDINYKYIVNKVLSHDVISGVYRYRHIRKITKPRETITIAGTTYDKSEFEAAVKDLKPIGESK